MADDGSFESFVRGNTSSLIRTAYLLAGSQYGAEELVQDTLAALYPRWARVAATESPLAYVRRSMANRFVSQRRRLAARDVSYWDPPERWDGTDLGEVIAARRTVWQLLQTLPERQRAAIVLRHFHDMTEAEIAAALGCRPASVRSLISRGMATMRAAHADPTTTAETGATR